MRPDDAPKYKQQTEKFLFADEIFQQDHQLFPSSPEKDQKQPELIMPRWLDETRLVCFMVGLIGLMVTILNLNFFYSQIGNAVLSNLALLLTLAGFVNFSIFPSLLKYSLVNAIPMRGILHSMSRFMIGFCLALLIFLFSFPISGLGLALILIPAPFVFSWYSRKYIDTPVSKRESHYSPMNLFNEDLRLLAWISFGGILIAFLAAFYAMLFGLI